MQQIDFRAMGCEMHAVLDADTDAARAALTQVPAWFDEWEGCLSRFRPDSELNALNRQAGVGDWVPVSETLWQVLALARQAADWSNDLVTPTLLPAMEFIGYDRSFDDLNRLPSMAMRLTSAPIIASWREIKIDATRHAVWLPSDTRLDFGGIAKGWAAQQATQRLGVYGSALVDAGGDIAVSGPRTDGSAWPVGVANPFAPNDDLAVLALKSGSVATSGRDYRRWRSVAGRDLHHLIDPRTGWPAQTEVLCTTVVADETWMAEAAAKTALILGRVDGLAWLESHSPPILGGLLVLEEGALLATTSWTNLLWSEHERI